MSAALERMLDLDDIDAEPLEFSVPEDITLVTLPGDHREGVKYGVPMASCGCCYGCGGPCFPCAD